MNEPRRLDAPTFADTAERDSQTEALLIDGLDRYFSGRYEDAMHLWTRVLFIDRSHARARAYIDRARTAMAERQRRADEMLQASRDLLDRGDTGAARDLLHEAVAVSGEDEHASALRHRLERAERLHLDPRPARPVAAPLAPVPGWTWPAHSHALAASFAAIAAALVLLAALATPAIQELVGLRAGAEPLTASPSTTPLPVFSSADVALVRARSLFERGRLAEALVALDRVGPHSAARPVADQLRVEIHQILLASGRSAGEPGRSAGAVQR